MKLVTTEDVEQMRVKLLREIISGTVQKEIPKSIKSREARKLLQISVGMLQQLRITGGMSFKKIGGKY